MLSFLAAVALARYNFDGRKLFIVFVIGIQMLPQAGLIIPLYVVLADYHQVNALSGVIITYLTFVLPFCVWTLRGFLLGIPKDLEEAAMVDGSTRVGVFMKILLPLMGPGLVATSVFAFITVWNEYIFARVLLNDQSKQTITVWLSYFLGSSRNTDWGAPDGRLDADGDPRRDLLPAHPAADRLRADRRCGARMTAVLEELASACIFPSFPGTAPPDWVRRFLAGGGGGIVLFAYNVPSQSSLRRCAPSCNPSGPASCSRSTRKGATSRGSSGTRAAPTRAARRSAWSTIRP